MEQEQVFFNSYYFIHVVKSLNLSNFHFQPLIFLPLRCSLLLALLPSHSHENATQLSQDVQQVSFALSSFLNWFNILINILTFTHFFNFFLLFFGYFFWPFLPFLPYAPPPLHNLTQLSQDVQQVSSFFLNWFNIFTNLLLLY